MKKQRRRRSSHTEGGVGDRQCQLVLFKVVLSKVGFLLRRAMRFSSQLLSMMNPHKATHRVLRDKQMLFEWVASSSTGGYCFCFVYDKYIQAFKDVVDDDDAKSALSRRR